MWGGERSGAEVWESGAVGPRQRPTVVRKWHFRKCWATTEHRASPLHLTSPSISDSILLMLARSLLVLQTTLAHCHALSPRCSGSTAVRIRSSSSSLSTLNLPSPSRLTLVYRIVPTRCLIWRFRFISVRRKRAAAHFFLPLQVAHHLACPRRTADPTCITVAAPLPR